jgi:O-antigen ligase
MIFVTFPASLVLQSRFGTSKQRLAAALLTVCLVAPAGSYYWWNRAEAGRKSPANIVRRIESWQGVLKITSMSESYRMIIGHGNMEDVYGKLNEHFKINIKGQAGIVHTHNVLVQTFLESGILGAVSLTLIWLLGFVGVFQVWLRDKHGDLVLAGPLLTAMLTIAVMGQMDYPLWSINGKIGWYLLGLSYAFIKISFQGKHAEI